MAFAKVGLLSMLPPGSAMDARVGDDAYAVCNLDGELFALSGTCPHAHGPIGQGMISGNFIVCPWHEYAFDCRTGANAYDPRLKLQTFAVKVDGDDILVDVRA
jgi:nitrite reductase (NADH) small subunit